AIRPRVLPSASITNQSRRTSAGFALKVFIPRGAPENIRMRSNKEGECYGFKQTMSTAIN
ncbi:hypothetical protein, partial [Candidatus Oleimmundimicrobium sp.]|uniref:hypothetical protein n=1 Tax=Candidatus Oleimmundimicrobium sp. TaxID=3060597 RepID=UPI002722C958